MKIRRENIFSVQSISMQCTILWRKAKISLSTVDTTLIELLDLLVLGVNYDGSRFQEALVKESFAPASIGSHHWDGAADAVRPVQVAMDPVEGDAFRSINVKIHNCAVMTWVFSQVQGSSFENKQWAPGNKMKINPYTYKYIYIFIYIWRSL